MKFFYSIILVLLFIPLTACLETAKKSDPDPAYSQLDYPYFG